MDEYEKDWDCIDEINNAGEEPYMELIKPKKYAEVRRELHRQVDARMRVEHELLRQARCKDLKEKYEKPKSKRVPRRIVGKCRRKRKSRRHPDITAEQSIDSLIAELVENDIIIDLPKKSFDEFIGDYNFLAYETRSVGKT